MPAQKDLEPRGKIHRSVRRRYADIPEVAGAITCWNVHAAAKRDGKMRIVAANPAALVEDLPGRHRRARMLVAKNNVVVNEIANGLNARPTRSYISK